MGHGFAETTHLTRECGAEVAAVLADAPELAVPLLEQSLRRLGLDLGQLAQQRRLEKSRSLFMVLMRSAGRLVNNVVDDAQRNTVGRGQAKRLRGGLGA